MKSKRRSASILFVNGRNDVLLVLRDDIQNIPYPNRWCIPGGHAEENETFEECIIREMREEMELDVRDFETYSIVEREDVVVTFFWKKVDFQIADMCLHEGQELRWFSEQDIVDMDDDAIAFHFKPLILSFMRSQA
jgi:8-oxo-dGTP diphosphatase